MSIKFHLTQPYRDADDDLKAYDLDHYDDDDSGGAEKTLPIFTKGSSLAYHESNADDPYITLPDDKDTDEERDDLEVLPSDNMILTAKVEDEVPQLEVYVYEDQHDNLFIHHDILLPAIPLCIEWLDLPVGQVFKSINRDQRGNFAAIGTMDPDIEIWDLDIVDALYPNAILGQSGSQDPPPEPQKPRKERKQRKKSKKPNVDFHVDAILSLASNRLHRNILASASADATVKLWDLSTLKCAKSYSHHRDKVCSIAWHPDEATILLSGSYDRTVKASDMRTPEAQAPTWAVESDVETISWDVHAPTYFFVTTESGMLHMHDIRSAPPKPEATEPVWTLQAHDDAVSSLDVNSAIPSYLATGSSDKTVKLWNVTPTGPSMIVSRNVGVGRVFSTRFAPEAEVAFRLAVSGSKGALQVWDTSTNVGVRRAFANRVDATKVHHDEERVVMVQADDEDDEDDSESEAQTGRVQNVDRSESEG